MSLHFIRIETNGCLTTLVTHFGTFSLDGATLCDAVICGDDISVMVINEHGDECELYLGFDMDHPLDVTIMMPSGQWFVPDVVSAPVLRSWASCDV